MGNACFGEAKWQQEVVVEHKFTYINLTDYRSSTLTTRIKYMFLYLLAFKDVISYLTDLLAVILLFRDGSGANLLPIDRSQWFLQVSFLKWVYLVCMVNSIILLAVDVRKGRRTIRSQDISFAFTSTLVFRYYAFQDYLYYSFFEQIHDMKRTKDRVALFVFFRLKDWKKLLFTQGPRNLINIYTLVSLYNVYGTNLSLWGNGDVFTVAAIVLIAIVTTIFVLSFVGTLVALFIYIPLICQIRGNLKEYVCHKIDKRIAQLIASSQRNLASIARINERRRINGQAPVPPPKLNVSHAVSLTAYQKPTLPHIFDDDIYYDTESAHPYGSEDGNPSYVSFQSRRSSQTLPTSMTQYQQSRHQPQPPMRSHQLHRQNTGVPLQPRVGEFSDARPDRDIPMDYVSRRPPPRSNPPSNVGSRQHL